MKRFIIIYLMIGVLLIVGLYFCNLNEISKIDKELYEEALSIEDKIEKEVWSGYRFSKYPLAMRKGKNEYIFHNESITKRKAVLPVYAFTAYEHEGKINIFMLPFEDLKSIIDPTGFSNNISQENQYIATIYHEGFHAYQMDNFGEIFNVIDFDIDIKDKIDDEKMKELSKVDDKFNLVFEKIDNDESIKNLYEKEGEILYNGIKNKSSKKDIALEYIIQRKKRYQVLKNKLSSDEYKTLLIAENRYELIEGTAKYIEVKTMEILEGKDVYNEIIEELKHYKTNNAKYYDTGMAMCILLDEIDNSWKNSVFEDNSTLFDKLKDSIGG